ncbi:unnamed protein product [Fusarium equiseti]|uniref:Uncharacterized protein n=1 Tax=Fusarium equiseti TaxID=61235 RepID=A0A8J2IPI0_FUSEQ|nr:unnamed protein product [Fusarium equiseti]
MSDTSRSPSATDYASNESMLTHLVDNPNTQALSKKLNLSSEIDCRNLMLRDITALPVREPLAPSSIASPTQPPLISCMWCFPQEYEK